MNTAMKMADRWRAALVGCVGLLFACEGLGGEQDISAMDDDRFLEMVQRDSAMYFIDQADPESGLIADSEFPANTHVGSNGFGLMAICIAAERGWISREDAAGRVLRILRTFREKAAQLHGAVLWITDRKTATKRVWNSGYDICETGYLCAGALVARQYFLGASEQERLIRKYADEIYDRVEFDWFLKDNDGFKETTLAWSYDPVKGRFSDLRIVGYHEAAIIYILAMGSRKHPIEAECWDGWAGGYRWARSSGQEYIFSPALFTHQYTQIWLDLRRMHDKHTQQRGITYFENSRRAALSHIEYARQNPLKHPGYGPIWGLSDCRCPLHKNKFGEHGVPAKPSTEWWANYKDDGTIAIAAGGASIMFTPKESIDFLRFVYKNWGARAYDRHGFTGAINVKTGWVDPHHDVLNKGAMVAAIENHRSGLIWRLFQQNPEIMRGMHKAGFRKVP